MDDLAGVLNTLLLVSVVAAVAPLIVALLPGPRVPQVVLLIIGGIMIGPQGFGLSDPAALILIANIGLGLVFLLAGYELDPAVFRERAGRLALTGWVITAALSAGLVGVLAAVGFVHAFVPVALGLTTTALGTLLPILRDLLRPCGSSPWRRRGRGPNRQGDDHRSRAAVRRLSGHDVRTHPPLRLCRTDRVAGAARAAARMRRRTGRRSGSMGRDRGAGRPHSGGRHP